MMKTKKCSNNVLLNPSISRTARLLWAVLRHCEQKGKREMDVEELASMLDLESDTVVRNLRELRENRCLTWKRYTGVQYQTDSPKPQPDAAKGKDWCGSQPPDSLLN